MPDPRRPRAASREDTSKHVLLLENYGKDKVVDKEWVLLEGSRRLDYEYIHVYVCIACVFLGGAVGAVDS